MAKKKSYKVGDIVWKMYDNKPTPHLIEEVAYRLDVPQKNAVLDKVLKKGFEIRYTLLVLNPKGKSIPNNMTHIGNLTTADFFNTKESCVEALLYV
jgi:hypothetical protein